MTTTTDFHDDNTATYYSVQGQCWVRTHVTAILNRDLAAMSGTTRLRVRLAQERAAREEK
jgi:hypothetical protein